MARGAAELLWVDILGRCFHRATLTDDGSPDRVSTTTLDRHVGAVAPVAGGGYVLAAGQGFLFVDEAGSIRELAQPEAGRVDVRMNDGACDPQGRFWAGTMAYDESPGAGTLYRLELDGRCSTVLTGLTISNGIGWSPDGGTMYLSDSGAGHVEAFDFDGATGTIGGRRTLLRIDEPGAAPDGLTVDEDGDIWVGIYGGWAVRRYGPDGSLRATVPIPAAQATSCAFGGHDRSTLFVTTGRERLDDAALERQPDAGRVFSVTGLDARAWCRSLPNASRGAPLHLRLQLPVRPGPFAIHKNGRMALQRMDNVGIVVESLDTAISFFAELGLELEGRAMIEGDCSGRVTGLRDQRVEIAMMRTPDGHGRIELSRFLAPAVVADHRNAPVNALGYLRVMFAVDDIDDTLARLRRHGAQLVDEVVRYEDVHRLCYVRGPEGILIGLAERIG